MPFEPGFMKKPSVGIDVKKVRSAAVGGRDGAVIRLVLLFFLPSIAFPAGPVALEDCYTAALEKSETVAEQQELLVQAREKSRQATGSLLPSINAVGSYQIQDAGKDPNSLRTTLAPTTQPMAKLTATQPLFKGGREYAALKIANRLTDAQGASLNQSRTLLFRDVVQGFFAVLIVERDGQIFGEELAAYETRIGELKDRERVGRSRQSEILAAQAALATLRAQGEQLKGSIAAARETLSFLTGLDRNIALREPEASSTVLEPLDAYLAGTDTRPDVVSAAFRKEAAHAQVGMAWGNFLPSIDLTGNYYLKRTGVNEPIKWDAQAAISLPLFVGGNNFSRLREAKSASRQGDAQFSRARRQAELDIRLLYSRTATDLAQVNALVSAADLSDRNYQEQSNDYRLGLVNNVEVMQALAGSQETRRALNRALYTLKADLATLDAAAARRPVPAKAAQ
jgi:outer membrane protein